MLDGLRKLGRTWLGKIVGAFLIVGLAGFGISNVLLDFGSSSVASVGQDDISSREFQRAYTSDLNRAAQQFGRFPSPEEALALGIPSTTLNQLASETALNRVGIDLGLGVSEERLGQLLRQDPNFAGTLGGFEPENFTRILQQSGYTEAEYFDLQTRASRRQQLVAAIFADAPVPTAAEELLARFSADTRTIDYFVLNAQSIPAVAEPDEAELAAYLADRQQQFRTDEQRVADILVLTLETLAASQSVTDEQISAEFERIREGRRQPERRTIVQVPLTPDLQAAFEAGEKAGRPFSDIAAQTGVTPTALGSLTRADVTDAALAAAAFGLARTGDFTIIPGIGGQRVVAVTQIEPGVEPTLEEARDDIVRSLQMAAARDQYSDILDQVEELRAAFQPLAQIATRFGLKLERVTLTRSGAALADVASVAAADRARVTEAVFAADPERLSPTITLGANSHIYVDLQAVEAARDQSLAEVRDDVRNAIVEARTTQALNDTVADAVSRLQGGEALDTVAASYNVFPQFSAPMTRSGDGSPALNATVAMAAFGGGDGYIGSAVNDDGDHVVFRVSEITPGGSTAPPELKSYIDDTTQQSLLGEFVDGIRNDAGVRINQQTLNQLLALDQAGQ